MKTWASIAVVATACVMSCCRENKQTTVDQPKPGPTRLVLYSWDDYFAPEVLEDFRKATGITVEYQTFGEAEEVEARLRSEPGVVDVVVVDSFNLNKLSQLRLLKPIEKDSLPNLKHMSARFLDLDCDRGNRFSVPYTWGTTLIAYRKDKLPQPEPSWKLLWNESYAGKVMMLDDTFEPMAAFLIKEGRSPRTDSEVDYAAAADALVKHVGSMHPRYGNDDAVKAALVAGEVWAAMCYSGDAAFAAAENDQIDFFVPAEGATLWVDCLAVPQECADSAAAHRFLNYMMDPAVAAKNANGIRYATANEAAEPLLDPALRNDPRLYPSPEVLSRCTFVPKLDAGRDALVKRYWHQVKLAIARADGVTPASEAP